MPIDSFSANVNIKRGGKKNAVCFYLSLWACGGMFKPTDIWPPLNWIFVLMPKSHK